jgi:hypothetical protein
MKTPVIKAEGTLYTYDPETKEYKEYGNLNTDHSVWDRSWPYGQYLITCSRNSLSMQPIPPQHYPELEAALLHIADKMRSVMREKANEPKIPKVKKLTKKQQDAWDAWKKAFREESVYLPSSQEIADAGIQALREYMVGLIESRCCENH